MIMRFAESGHETHPSAQASEYFARLVQEKSQGKIRIKVYFDGQLGSPSQVLEQLKFGGIALGRVDFASLNEAVPSINDFSSKIISQNLFCRDKIIENMAFISEKSLREKLYPLSVFYPDKRVFYTDSPRFFKKSLSSLKGIKAGCQSSSILQNELKKYGILPLDAVAADSYQSMQKGFFNVREGDFMDFVLGNDYYFADYIMISDYIANPSLLIMSNEVWKNLSVEQRKILEEAAWEAALFQFKMMDRFYTANMESVKRNKKVLTLEEGKR